MKKKLFDIKQENLVECDNPKCDYVIVNETKEMVDIDQYLNKPCPKCGENLLTEKDLKDYKSLKRALDWSNKWLGWLGYIFPTDRKKGEIKVHNGVDLNYEDEK